MECSVVEPPQGKLEPLEQKVSQKSGNLVRVNFGRILQAPRKAVDTRALHVPHDAGTSFPTIAIPDASNQDQPRVERASEPRPPSKQALICYDTMKQLIDISVAATALALLSPLLAGIALLVKITSPGPVLYTQRRLSMRNKVFTMYKFRSMRHNAESETGAVWASRNDNRSTPLGRILRSTHLDELPQLLNVVRGEMSLIGPRPERPEFAAQLEQEFPSFRLRTTVKPGITGLAQVSSGYAATMTSYRRKLAFDRLYIRRRSAGLDLKIAARTIVLMLHGE